MFRLDCLVNILVALSDNVFFTTCIWVLLSETRLIRPNPMKVPEGDRCLSVRIYSIFRVRIQDL